MVEISYKKLWKLLIDKGISKIQLREKLGLGTGALSKLGKNDAVSLEILAKICLKFKCQIGDIMEFIYG